MLLQLIKCAKLMKDNSDIPLPTSEIRSKVCVFAITEQGSEQYQQVSKGYVDIVTDEDDKNGAFHYLQVKDVQTGEILLRSNLKLQNDYGKQKGSIISWTDQEQYQYSQLALSFQKDKQCDMFWRTLCQKIGKNYLQISGNEKLQVPSCDNLNYILQKAKNSVDLMDYNIVHSKSTIHNLKKIFYQMKKESDEMGMGMVSRIVNTIISPSYSLNSIQALLTGQSFFFILDAQQFKKRINFRQIYDQKVGLYLQNRLKLPKQVFEKVELNQRAIFYRQNVLDFIQQAQLQTIMYTISKQALVQIMVFLNRSKFIQRLIQKQDETLPSQILKEQKSSMEQQSNQATKSLQNKQNGVKLSAIQKISFIHECLIMYQQISSEQIKNTFKEHLYVSGIFQFLKTQIESNNLKAMQIIYYICEIDKTKLFQYIVQDFKSNSSDNLMKIIMKKYIHEKQFRGQVISLVQSLTVIFNQKKELLDFFNGTFLCSVLLAAKDLRCILLLCNTLMSHLQNSSTLFSHFIKAKVFEKFAAEYRHGSCLKTKEEELQMVQLLKHIIVEQSHRNGQKNSQIEKNLIDSGYFDCCLMIFGKYSQKNNLINSSMLQNLKLIQKMSYSQFDEYLVKQDSSYEFLSKFMISIRKKHIEFLVKKSALEKQSLFAEGQQMAHAQILQNQQQDDYLMNEQTYNVFSNHRKSEEIEEQKSYLEQEKHLSAETNQQSKRQIYLLDLKRMMEDINSEKQDEDSIIQAQPRKIVKRNQSQQPPQSFISFSFDLPDIEDVEQSGQLKDP